jgi:hypothetical protein
MAAVTPQNERESVPSVHRLLGGYAFFALLTAGLCVGLAFSADDVGISARLFGLLSVPLGLATAYLLRSPRFRTRRVTRPAGSGVAAVVLGIGVAEHGGAVGGLILLGFGVGFFLYCDWIFAERIQERARNRSVGSNG